MTVFGMQISLKKTPALVFIPASGPLSLTSVPAGKSARVLGLGQGLSRQRSAQLLAYGLAEGRQVRVIQHYPVCVIQVDHLELALENSLAAQVLVEVV